VNALSLGVAGNKTANAPQFVIPLEAIQATEKNE
jgi:hypothetical protein